MAVRELITRSLQSVNLDCCLHGSLCGHAHDGIDCASVSTAV